MEPGELVRISIEGLEVEVPGDVCLLRAFQYLRVRSIMAGGFCWNADCMTCEVDVDFGRGVETVLACQEKVRPGMRIVGLSAVLKHCLRGLRDEVAKESSPAP